MKKRLLKLSSAILSATMLMSSLTLFSTSATEVTSTEETAQETFAKAPDIFPTFSTGDLTLTENAHNENLPDDVKVISSAEDYYNIATANGTDLKISASTTSHLPTSIDNSQSPYFPPIGNQGGLGSCVAWAQAYYQFSYTMNKQRNVATTADNAFSPKFIYNLTNGGNDNGLVYSQAYEMMIHQGNVPMSVAPYDDNYTSWSPTENVWRESVKYQVKDYQTFDEFGKNEKQITSADDEDLIPVKTALSNGEVLAFSTYVYSFNVDKLKTNSSAPENSKFAEEEVVTHLKSSEGSHRMALVGYNDNIWTDINQNDKIDNGEMGAFKIANSWGDGYGNDGFIWVAYDALNADSCLTTEVENRTPLIQFVTRIDVHPYNYSGDFYLKVTLNSSARGQSQLYIQSERNGTISEARGFAPLLVYTNTYNLSYDGSTNATDGTFFFPLKNTSPELTSENFEEYTWSVKFCDGSTEISPTIVKNAELVNAQTGKVYKPNGVFPFTIDGEDRTIEYTKSNLKNIVVYYRGYDNPQIHYKLGTNSWKTDSMENNLERRGSLYKYVIPCSTTSTAKLYFTNADGNTDNNNGNYYTATTGLNYYNTDSYRAPLKVTLNRESENGFDVNQCPYLTGGATGGYEPYVYRYSYTNLDTGEVKEYREDKSPDSGVVGLRILAEGNYRISLKVQDYADQISYDSFDIYIKNEPFIFKEVKLLQGDKVVAGQPVDIYAETKYESVKSWGNIHSMYKITVKKGDKTYYENERRSTKFNTNKRTSTTIEQWTPYETGTYTVTVSSTDGNKEYAEGSCTFEVKDHKIGDVDINTEINIRDATLLQMFIARYADESEINSVSADVNKDGDISISDATNIQMSVANLDSTSYVGEIVPVEIPPQPTEPPTKPTDPPTEPPTNPDTNNKVYFTNSHKWGGTVSCYYWSDSNKSMTSWPGKAMTLSETNQYGESIYTFDVPSGATYVIFTNGSSQTVDIPYSGGVVKYYPLTTTDNQGHYLVQTW